MPTIKTKKEMNLLELIEYIAETGYKTKSYTSNDNGAVVGVGLLKGIFINGTIFPNHTFTVEIEEEIKEDTVIPKMVSIGRENQNEIKIHYSRSIGQFLDNEDFNYYVLNDDDTLTLIWRNGKLVE